jgi:myo-inositol-1(or 4)-monophosphatase
MNNMNREELMRKLTLKGGKIILDNFQKVHNSWEKTKDDYSTNVDLEIEENLMREIKKRFPEDGILSEESEKKEGKSEYVWIMDPLDGTNNYVRGIPQAGIQIALEKNGKTSSGIIYNPFVQEIYTVKRGQHAYKELLDGSRKRIKVSNKKLKDSFMIFEAGLKKDETGLKKLIFDEMIKEVGHVRIYGVAAQDLPYVACGRADALISLMAKPWDVATGILLIEEAGGRVTTIDGKTANQYSNNLIASNGVVHNQVLEIVKYATRKK